MVHAKIYNVIGTSNDALMMQMEGMEDAVFTVETIHNLFNANPTEQDFTFHINCAGGNTAEGLAAYDVLRTSGKNIFMNVDGACHSMAVTLLLAAPLENRTANPNAKALIHTVKASPENVDADQLRMLAGIVEKEQSDILNIYADRTGQELEFLTNLMKEEKMRNASELLKYGFISKINNYTTNQKKETMSKQKFAEVLNSAEKMIAKLVNLVADNVEETPIVNYDFMDADGVVLFSTEKEDDSLEVGDVATPDGTYTLTDGRAVVIAEGVVTEISEPMSEMEVEISNLKNQLETLTAENAELKNTLTESAAVMTELKNSLGSTFEVKTRNSFVKPVLNQVLTNEERKAAIREKLKK